MYLIAKVKAVPMLYFQKPKQLLSIFTDLEDENLKLIQECREAEGNLEKIRTSVREVSWMKIDPNVSFCASKSIRVDWDNFQAISNNCDR